MGEIDLRRDAQQQVHLARRKNVGFGIAVWTVACILVSYFASLSIFATPMLVALAVPPCTVLAIFVCMRFGRKPKYLGLPGPLEREGVARIANTDNDDNIADVVFVHGLTGGAYKTWSYRTEGQEGYFFWPKALGEDLPQCGIWSLSYAAGISNWFGASGMAIQDRARNLVLKLLNAGIGKRPIIFVAHSMGGLEIKEIIVRSQTRGTEDWRGLVDEMKAIVFCGTPHRGAHIATAVKTLSLFIRTQEHVQQMEMGSSGLDTLHDEFLAWQARTKVAVESYIEKNGLYRDRKWGNPSPLGLVVSLESGNPQIVGSDCFPIAADHINLVKPASRESDIYGGVLRFIRKTLKLEAPANHPAPGTSTSSRNLSPSPFASGSGVSVSLPEQMSEQTSPPVNVSGIRKPPELREGHIVKSVLASKEFKLRIGLVTDVSKGPELVGVKYPNYEVVQYYDALTLELEDEQLQPLAESEEPHVPLVVIHTKTCLGAIMLHEGPTFLCADVSWWQELPQEFAHFRFLKGSGHLQAIISGAQLSTEGQIVKTFRELISSQGGILLRVDDLWSTEHSETRNKLIDSIMRASFEDPRSGPRFGALYDFARRAGPKSETVIQAFHRKFAAMRVAECESSISPSGPVPPVMHSEKSVTAPATLDAERAKRRLRVWEDLRAFARTRSQSATHTLLISLESLGAISSQGVFISLPHVLAWVRFEWQPDLRLSLVTRGELDYAVTPWGIHLSSAEILIEFEHNLYADGVLGGRLEEIITEDIFAKLADLALLATEVRLGRAPIEIGIETARKNAAPSNLSKILAYPNPDWAVTEFGLECVLHTYPIEVDRLDRSRWYEHMREKDWVDIEFFDDALTAATHLHAALTSTTLDPPSSTSS